MAQIRWDNINAPNFGDSASLTSAGTNTISRGLEALRSGVSQVGDAMREKELVSSLAAMNQNTQDVANKLLSLKTSDDVGKFDLSKFGSNVDRKYLTGLKQDILGKLEDNELKWSNYRLRQQALRNEEKAANLKQALAERKLNQKQFHDDRQGTIYSLDPNSGEVAAAAEYKKVTGKATKEQSKLKKQMLGMRVNSLLESSGGDESTFIQNVASMLQQEEGLTNKERLDEIAKAKDWFKVRSQVTPEQQATYLTPLDNAYELQRKNYLGKLNVADEELNAALGIPLMGTNSPYGLKDRKDISISTALKNRGLDQDADDMQEAQEIVVSTLGRLPNGAELLYILNKAGADDSWSFESTKIKEATKEYAKNILNSSHAKLREEVIALRTKAFNTLDALKDKHIRKVTRDIADKNISGTALADDYGSGQYLVNHPQVQKYFDKMDALIKQTKDNITRGGKRKKVEAAKNEPVSIKAPMVTGPFSSAI